MGNDVAVALVSVDDAVENCVVDDMSGIDDGAVNGIDVAAVGEVVCPIGVMPGDGGYTLVVTIEHCSAVNTVALPQTLGPPVTQKLIFCNKSPQYEQPGVERHVLQSDMRSHVVFGAVHNAGSRISLSAPLHCA